jgi:hypothetical protein
VKVKQKTKQWERTMKNSRIMLWLVAIPLVMAQFGCASLGKSFELVTGTPSDQSVVYIYRPSSFVGGGVSYTVYSGKKAITKLYNGGYYPYVTAPGEVELWAETESKSSVTVDVKAGETKYVKGTVGVGFFIGRPNLSIVDPAVAQTEIKECKLIPEEQLTDAK